MKHSLAQRGAAAAARQGRQAAHVAPDAPPRARATTITYLSFTDPTQTAGRSRRHARSRVSAGHRAAHAIRRRARCASTPTRRATSSIRVPYAVAQVSLAPRIGARIDALLATGRFDAVVCDFLPPVVNLPTQLPCPAILFTHNVEAEIWRRHAENATQSDCHGVLLRAAVAADAALRARRRWPASICVLAVSDADRETFARLYPDALTTPVHVVPDRRRHRIISRRRPAASARRAASRLHRLDGLAAERRRRCCTSAARFCRASAQAEPDATLSIIGRSPTPAVKRLADDAGIEVTGRVDDVRPHMADAARLRRAAAYRRRHAPEDLRSDGDGQGGGLDDRRRRGAAGDATEPTSSSPTNPPAFAQAVVASDPRRPTAPADRDRRRARWSSSSTTGRPSRRISKTR